MEPESPSSSDLSGSRYWDPVPHIRAALQPTGSPKRRLLRGSRPVWPQMIGNWEERNWRNVPGPIYGCLTDNCWVGRPASRDHFLYGDDEDYESEFLFRQPRTQAELDRVLVGMLADPFGGWAYDGDERWTVESVQDWWQDRGRLREWVDTKAKTWSLETPDPQVVDVINGLRDYARYIDTALEEDLRIYCFWLDTGRSPKALDRLPAI